MKKVVVGIAEGKTARAGQTLTSYALGSCVGICLYDEKKKIAAMAHIILPDMSYSVNQDNAYKFATEGTRELIREICRCGAQRRRLVAKIAGGSDMFGAGGDSRWDIGHWNTEGVKKTLLEEHIRLVAEDTGGRCGRTITFFPENGMLQVSTVRKEIICL